MSGTSKSDEMLARARNVVSGGEAAEAVRPLVAEVAAAARQMHMQFLWDADGNPEMPAETVREVGDALQRYQQTLEALDGALAANDAQRAQAAADDAEAARQRIRDAQAAYVARQASEGPTTFAFLNRLLVHLEYFERGGRESRFALALLNDLPEFLRRLEHDGAGLHHVSGDGAAASCVRDIRRDTEAVDAALRSGAPVPAVRGRLLKSAQTLRDLTTGTVEAALSNGPTPLLPVNLVLHAADAFIVGKIDAAMLHEAIHQCREGLRAQVTGMDVQSGLQPVLDSLSRLEAAPDAETVAAEVPMLTGATQGLTWLATMASTPEWEDEDTLVDFVLGEGGPAVRAPSGLPKSLQDIIDVGAAFVGGQSSAEELLEAVERLDRIISRFSGEAARMGGNEAGYVQEGLEMLGEAAESLRTLAATRDRRALDAARAIMVGAADLFASMRA